MNAGPAVTAEGVKWQVESLRVTTFHVPPLDVAKANWWETLNKRAPDIHNYQRSPIGQLIEQGIVGEYSLQLLANELGRIDWVAGAKPKEPPDEPGFALLGQFDQAWPPFRDLISQWLIDAPTVNRLAVGAQLYIPVKNAAEAREVLESLLPSVKINWKDIRDFILQLNRPQKCVTLPGVGDLNCLMKWQSVVRRTIVGQVVPAGGPGPLTTRENFAASLDLDINTPGPEVVKSELTRDSLPALLRELGEKATQLTHDKPL